MLTHPTLDQLKALKLDGMRVNAFGLAAGWKLCAKMRLSAFTHMIFRARNWKPRKSKWISGKSPRRFRRHGSPNAQG